MWNARVNHFLSVGRYLICGWQQHHISVIQKLTPRGEWNNQYIHRKMRELSEEIHVHYTNRLRSCLLHSHCYTFYCILILFIYFELMFMIRSAKSEHGKCSQRNCSCEFWNRNEFYACYQCCTKKSAFVWAVFTLGKKKEKKKTSTIVFCRRADGGHHSNASKCECKTWHTYEFVV